MVGVCLVVKQSACYGDRNGYMSLETGTSVCVRYIGVEKDEIGWCFGGTPEGRVGWFESFVLENPVGDAPSGCHSPTLLETEVRRILACESGASGRVLGVADDADQSNISSHYRQAMQLLHPDKNKRSDEAALGKAFIKAAFVLVQDAHADLSLSLIHISEPTRPY